MGCLLSKREIIYDYRPLLSTKEGEIESLKNRLNENPGDYELHRRLGLAYAYSNNKNSSLYEMKLAVSMLNVEVDALYGPFFLFSLAEVYHLFGNKSEKQKIFSCF